MDILNYSNNVIHILLEFFFDTIIEFFFWLDYHNISFWMIIAGKKYKIICKKLHRMDLSADNLCNLCGNPTFSACFFYDRRELFCPRILSFRSGSR